MAHLCRAARPRWLLIAVALSVLAAGCGGGASGAERPDAGATPAYTEFLRSLRDEGLPARAISVKPVNGHWSNADAIAAAGCQCAAAVTTLYIEHRLRVHGQIIVVDEELLAGAAADAGGDGAAEQKLRRYRLENLVVTTSANDARLLGVLDKLSRARASE
jgi:hypothetical protein